MQLGLGSAPASGALSRASRLNLTVEIDSPFSAFQAAEVRREAHRTAPEAGALPDNSTAWLRINAALLRRNPPRLISESSSKHFCAINKLVKGRIVNRGGSILKMWICALGIISAWFLFVNGADSQSVYSVHWPTTHAAPPATLPNVSPTELAAYRVGLVFTPESNVVDLVTSQNEAFGISVQQAAYFKNLFGERYHLIETDPLFRDAPSALSYCFSAETPTQGLALVYSPRKLDANLAPLVFLHGYGGSFLWSQQLLAEYFPDRLIICPAFGISSASMPAAYLSECLKAVQKKVAHLIRPPILIGLSAGGFGAARIFTKAPEQFSRLIVLAAYPPQDTLTHFDKTMSACFMVGAKEDYVKSGVFAQYMQAIRPRLGGLEVQTIPDADHFFLLEKRAEALKILRLWIDSPAARPVVKKGRTKAVEEKR
jgi:pimeloyl-ACP methyl ester carboxylesterase